MHEKLVNAFGQKYRQECTPFEDGMPIVPSRPKVRRVQVFEDFESR